MKIKGEPERITNRFRHDDAFQLCITAKKEGCPTRRTLLAGFFSTLLGLLWFRFALPAPVAAAVVSAEAFSYATGDSPPSVIATYQYDAIGRLVRKSTIFPPTT